MANEEHGARQDQLEKHSLPGTNQAGKGPGKPGSEDEAENPPARGAHEQDQLEKHSLPGTNQAGKGASEGPP
jgi:hypothetical protein